jgi:hypothetical protein
MARCATTKWCSRLALRSKASPHKRKAARTVLWDSQMHKHQRAMPSLFAHRSQHFGHEGYAVDHERLLRSSLNLHLPAQLNNPLP